MPVGVFGSRCQLGDSCCHHNDFIVIRKRNRRWRAATGLRGHRADPSAPRGRRPRRPVVELRRLRRRVPRALLRVLQRPPVRQVRRESSAGPGARPACPCRSTSAPGPRRRGSPGGPGTSRSPRSRASHHPRNWPTACPYAAHPADGPASTIICAGRSRLARPRRDRRLRGRRQQEPPSSFSVHHHL